MALPRNVHQTLNSGLGDDSPPSLHPAIDNQLETYRKAGRSQNTVASYQQAIKHFQNQWQGLLPASTKSIARYITAYAPTVSIGTLRIRLAALADWHKKQGYPDPTKAPEVQDVMRGIAKKHPKAAKQALPLAFDHLEVMVESLEHRMSEARNSQNIAEMMRCSRDRALLLIGFWRGFRSDELSRITVQGTKVFPGIRMEIFLPFSKTDRMAKGVTYELQALKAYCPVTAYRRWLEDSAIVSGPVFCGIDRWGKVSVRGMNNKCIGPILNDIAKKAGLDIYLTTHSMRRGFALWAADEGWDIHAVMQYVGWKSYDNAKRYVPARFSFGKLALAPIQVSSSRSAVPVRMDEGLVIAGEVLERDNR